MLSLLNIVQYQQYGDYEGGGGGSSNGDQGYMCSPGL